MNDESNYEKSSNRLNATQKILRINPRNSLINIELDKELLDMSQPLSKTKMFSPK